MTPNENVTRLCRHPFLTRNASNQITCALCGIEITNTDGKSFITKTGHPTTTTTPPKLPNPPTINSGGKILTTPNVCAHDYTIKGSSYICSKCGSAIPIKNCGCGK